MHTFFHKKTLLLAGFFLIFILCSFFASHFFNENRRFEKQAALIFQDEMTADTLSMHYKIAHPENFGISEYHAVLPCYSPDARQTSLETVTAYLDKLSHISPQRLNPGNRYTYALLVRYLNLALEGSSYAYFENPLSPSSGMQSQLPILLAEYTFRSRQDVEDYLTLLDQTDEYFASLAVYEQEKCKAGLSPADTSLSQVIRQCQTILSKKDLAGHNHFLQTTFEERITPLVQSGILTQSDADLYLSRNDRLLSTVMQPAYDRLADDLFLLMGDGTSSPRGLAAYPMGKEYYTHLLKQTTGSSRSVEDIKKMLYTKFQAEYQTFRKLLSVPENMQALQNSMGRTQLFPYHEAAPMLDDLQARMAASFPAFPHDAKPHLTVKPVSSSLAAYCAPAFYLTPPLDDIDTNVIYINPASASTGLALYTTLAHEGYPGHLYQSVYSQLFMQQQETNPVRQLLWYGGYLEGWALYVEFLSYDYAAELAQENGVADAVSLYEIEKHSRSLQLCLYSLLDLSIHYDNASYEQVQQVLNGFGISDPAVTQNIYNYICEEPACYLKYYLGYLEILDLKENARAKWQKDYTDLRFHQFFLECGPSDFDTLKKALCQEPFSSIMLSRYPLSHNKIFNFLAASTAGAVKY